MIKEKDLIKEECKHKRMRTYRKKDKTMLCGFDEHDVCLDCGMKRFHMKMCVGQILKIIAKDLQIDRTYLSARDIYKGQGNKKYFNMKIKLVDCKELLSNPDKYI